MTDLFNIYTQQISDAPKTDSSRKEIERLRRKVETLEIRIQKLEYFVKKLIDKK